MGGSLASVVGCRKFRLISASAILVAHWPQFNFRFRGVGNDSRQNLINPVKIWSFLTNDEIGALAVKSQLDCDLTDFWHVTDGCPTLATGATGATGALGAPVGSSTRLFARRCGRKLIEAATIEYHSYKIDFTGSRSRNRPLCMNRVMPTPSQPCRRIRGRPAHVMVYL